MSLQTPAKAQADMAASQASLSNVGNTMYSSSASPSRPGRFSLFPLLLMALLFLGFGLLLGFGNIPMLLVFILTAVASLFTLRNMPLGERVSVFSSGSGAGDMMLMVWIFVLAGAFSATAKGMGAIDTTVGLTLYLLPSQLLLPGLFLAACFVSLAIGTSVGTVVALTPIAAGLAEPTGLGLPLLVAAVTGGAFFGDNLSFISDTTVIATRSQGCRMHDKFRANVWIATPAALAVCVLYALLGAEARPVTDAALPAEQWKMIPYLAVLITAIAGMNVLLVLALGVLLSATVGLLSGSYSLASFCITSCDGITAMGELIMVSMLAGGLMAVMQRNGAIPRIVQLLTARVRSARGAELSIAGLVSLTNLCTANNTVAILSTGSLARAIAQRFGIAPQRAASLLDTFSCCVQGLIPYGAQLLMAAGLAAVSPTDIIPYLYYPMALTVTALLFIALGIGNKSRK